MTDNTEISEHNMVKHIILCIAAVLCLSVVSCTVDNAIEKQVRIKALSEGYCQEQTKGVSNWIWVKCK